MTSMTSMNTLSPTVKSFVGPNLDAYLAIRKKAVKTHRRSVLVKDQDKVTLCFPACHHRVKDSYEHKLYRVLSDIEDLINLKTSNIIIVFDLHNTTIKHVDLQFLRSLKPLQTIFRDLITEIHIINAPMYFRFTFKLVKPIFSKRLVDKISIRK